MAWLVSEIKNKIRGHQLLFIDEMCGKLVKNIEGESTEANDL